MNENASTFERLVLSLESSERQSMLRQLAETSERQTDALKASAPQHNEQDDASNLSRMKFADEPFLVKLWFRICAFFSSVPIDRVYDDYLVGELGKRLARTASSYIDVRKGSYSEAFCNELVRLRSCQLFFSPLLSAYENDKGDFYIVLGSLLMKDTCNAIAVTSDPFSIPYDQDPKKDVRSFFLREMDTVIQGIPESERLRMYQSAQAIEWIKRFCELPFERMAGRFGVMDSSGRMCLVDAINDDLEPVVGLFAGARRIPVLLLESLFLFSRQGEIQEGKFDMERECRQFVDMASNHLAAIGVLNSSLPLVDFVRFAVKDVHWVPTVVEGGEDWFLAFRNAWKKRFEDKWIEWNALHRKSILERNICGVLDVAELRPLQYHPWEGMWLPLSMRRELSVCFVKEFFRTVYVKKIMRPLKILLLDGEFYRRENLAEYTDAFSVLEHQAQALDSFEQRLSPQGDIGEGFAFVLNEKMATLKGKARLENLMLTVDSEAEMMINRLQTAFRSIDLVLGGILDVVRGGPYETLVNMASIQGKFNEQYRKELSMVRRVIREAQAVLVEAESIEKESL
jgi:hypothetical protein